MTLRSLEDRPFRAVASDLPRTALAFAFDSAYLDPFKVMIGSLLRAGTLLDCPVLVYTDDPGLLDDPVVRRVADRMILIEGIAREELYRLARDNVGRPERADWNRGTCLKWAVFEEGETDQVLFLDVDLLCLGPLEPLLESYPKADLVACPQFQRPMLLDDEDPVAMSVAYDRLQAMIAGGAPAAFRRRVNSGVMLARKRLLSANFKARLIEFARRRVEINEQSHLTKFFRSRENRDYRLALASSGFNFQAGYFAPLDDAAIARLLDDVRILHFAGASKPWLPDVIERGGITTALWQQHRRAAEEMGLLDPPPSTGAAPGSAIRPAAAG